jgi:hypothetical protein
MIETYSQLQAAIADWLARNDLSARIPQFIQFAEAEIRRRLNYESVRAPLMIAAEVTPLPANCKSLRSVWMSGNDLSTNWPLTVVTPDVLAERRREFQRIGKPQFASVLDNALHVVPWPTGPEYPPDVLLTEDSEPLETEDSEGNPIFFNAEIVYYTRMAPLSNANPSNEILRAAPDAYLYGALMHAAPFLEHDERIPVWREHFERAMLQLEIEKDHEEYGASFRPIRLPRVF